jgi:hypothetical protein
MVQEGSWYHCWCSYLSRPAMRNLSNAMLLRTTFVKLAILSKWFCDTSTGAAIGAARYGSFVGKAFSLLVVSSR